MKFFTGTLEEILEQLKSNDTNPCAQCGTFINKHSHLFAGQIKQKRECGNTVLICESLIEMDGKMFRCVVTTPPPDNPCDSAFMEDIST